MCSSDLDDQRVRCQQLLLAFDAEFVEQDVPRITQQLLIGHSVLASARRSTAVFEAITVLPCN